MGRQLSEEGEMKMEGRLEQLWQLRVVTWDGDVISKSYRDELVKVELVQRCEGWNWLTKKGVEYLINLGLLRP